MQPTKSGTNPKRNFAFKHLFFPLLSLQKKKKKSCDAVTRNYMQCEANKTSICKNININPLCMSNRTHARAGVLPHPRAACRLCFCCRALRCAVLPHPVPAGRTRGDESEVTVNCARKLSDRGTVRATCGCARSQGAWNISVCCQNSKSDTEPEIGYNQGAGEKWKCHEPFRPEQRVDR